MDHIDCAVIGAGVVGLAVARALARAGREVVILEAATAIGTETSSRNSEVIHAGIYYPPGSLKAQLCREGKALLYRFCESRGVAHRRLGKLIVATEPEQLPALVELQANAEANQVTDVRWLDANAVRRLEPSVRGVGGLFSPSTGIVDSHGLMVALLAEAQAHGATLVLRHPVTGGEVGGGGTVIRVGGDAPSELSCCELVNCGGLRAPALARRIGGLREEFVPEGYLCKGNYFALPRRAPFSHLVYPAPEQAGLGVHLTLDLDGMPRFGPDVEWVESVDYRVDPARAEAFDGAIRKYWPDLPMGALQPGYAGVRPKIVGPGQPAADFQISGPAEHGVSGQVHLFGIESPGLTACLAIADEVLRCLDEAPSQGQPF